MDPSKRNINSSRDTSGGSNMALEKASTTHQDVTGLLCVQKTQTLAYYTKQNFVQYEVKRIDEDALTLW